MLDLQEESYKSLLRTQEKTWMEREPVLFLGMRTDWYEDVNIPPHGWGYSTPLQWDYLEYDKLVQV